MKAIKIGQLVQVKSREAKQSINYPENGTLVGVFTSISGKRAIVQVRKDRHVAVDIDSIYAIK